MKVEINLTLNCHTVTLRQSKRDLASRLKHPTPDASQTNTDIISSRLEKQLNHFPSSHYPPHHDPRKREAVEGTGKGIKQGQTSQVVQTETATLLAAHMLYISGFVISLEAVSDGLTGRLDHFKGHRL